LPRGTYHLTTNLYLPASADWSVRTPVIILPQTRWLRRSAPKRSVFFAGRRAKAGDLPTQPGSLFGTRQSDVEVEMETGHGRRAVTLCQLFSRDMDFHLAPRCPGSIGAGNVSRTFILRGTHALTSNLRRLAVHTIDCSFEGQREAAISNTRPTTLIRPLPECPDGGEMKNWRMTWVKERA